MSYEPSKPVAGTQVLIGLGTAKTLTPPAGATRAVVQASAQNVRWLADGQTPTASFGMLLAVGSELTLDGDEMAAAKFIEVTAGASLIASYTRDL